MAESPLRVLIAGAGVAALEAALALRDLVGDRVTVELVAPEEEFVYRPLAVAAPFRIGEARRFPLRRLVEAAGATLTQGAVRGVDAERKLLTTDDDQELAYDALLLALGTRPLEAIEGAFTFRGPQDEAELERILEQARSGWVRRLVFALPAELTWPMPLYELALLTRIHLSDHGVEDVAVEIVSPEAAPLELFGMAASDAIRELLEIRGIKLTLNTVPTAVEDGWLQVSSGNSVRADQVIALPRLEGMPLEGVPHNEQGFVEVDEHGQVFGLDDVWAAGDLTNFSIKQGGLATQQADAAAESIAAWAGADLQASAVRSRSARAAPDRALAALHPRRAHRRAVCFRHGAALVAAGEDRRALSGAVPRYRARVQRAGRAARPPGRSRGRSRRSKRHELSRKPRATNRALPDWLRPGSATIQP